MTREAAIVAKKKRVTSEIFEWYFTAPQILVEVNITRFMDQQGQNVRLVQALNS